MSFLGALMNAAQLGLEPNTPLGQAYLIPYRNKGKLECQFQIGYKGLIDMVYRNENIQTVQAQCVYENDDFQYELGLDPKLVHKPALKDRGTPEKTVLYENLIKTCFQQKYGQKRFSDDAYVVANILAYFEPPKSISKKKRAEMLEGKIWPAKKPDSDNIAKVVLDALNGIAYHDDTQIIKLSVTKAYKEEAYLSVTLMRFDT